MSEYQYIEFLAIDRPLSHREMDKLRAISSRAQITSVNFVNEYSYGGLKANPRDFMREFFDVHVFLANWLICATRTASMPPWPSSKRNSNSS